MSVLVVAAIASVASSDDEYDDGDGSPTPDNGPWVLMEGAAGAGILLNATNLSASRGIQTTLSEQALNGVSGVTGTLSMEVSACVTGTNAVAGRLRVLLIPAQPISGDARESAVAVCPSSTSFALAAPSFNGCALGSDCVRGFEAVFQRTDPSPAGDLSVGWSVTSEAEGTYGNPTPPAGTVLTLTVEP